MPPVIRGNQPASSPDLRAALPLSSRTFTYVSGIIRRHRASIGSCWRKLNPGQPALLVLVHLRKGETLAGHLAKAIHVLQIHEANAG